MFTFKWVWLYEQTVLSVGERDSLRAQEPPVADHTALHTDSISPASPATLSKLVHAEL